MPTVENTKDQIDSAQLLHLHQGRKLRDTETSVTAGHEATQAHPRNAMMATSVPPISPAPMPFLQLGYAGSSTAPSPPAVHSPCDSGPAVIEMRRNLRAPASCISKTRRSNSSRNHFQYSPSNSTNTF